MSTQNPAPTLTKKSRIAFPHQLILIGLIVLLACLLTYILPAGVYEKDAATDMFDPTTFHYVEQTPVTPLKALLSIQPGIARAATIISLLLVIGGVTNIVLSVGAIESLINYAIMKLEDRSIKVLVPSIVAVMSLLGALAGNDSMMAFVAVGLIIVQKLKLDRITAVALFYMAYITGQAAGPTTAPALVMQSYAEVPPVSGLGGRMIIWVLLTIVNMVYTTRYALRVSRDPSKSIMGYVEGADGAEAAESIKGAKLEAKSIASILVYFGCYALFAFGSKTWEWGFEYLIACILVASVIIAVLYKVAPNRYAALLAEGAKNMGGVCLVLGVAQVVGMTLTNGNVIHTIAHAAAEILSGLSSGIAAIGMFIFNLMFNILVPSGTTQAAIVMPITVPMGDVMGITRQVIALATQLGDGLTNCVTPVSAVMMGAITIGGVSYNKWLRYALPQVAINGIIAIVSIFVLQTMGWVG